MNKSHHCARFTQLIFNVLCVCGLIAGTAAVLTAQPDTSLLLKPERLSEKDIVPQIIDLSQARAVSATRSLSDLDDLPFNVWVVTAEDILLNGFVTLADVLKAAPGIRVSQPGNAVEGETFLMRGLSGNQYVKIMINDVPIKSAVCGGMPIGAQIPIRQAERIEVFFGPASAVYGNEAFAGVVNIILKETERPVFTQADLGFGRYGYNSLDLTFGGKLGKDKKIFRYSLYGSSTIRDRTDVFYDENLYNPNNYLLFGLDSSLYMYNPNYRFSETNSALPKLSPVAHQSRMFGINLTWRGIHFTYHRMSRIDYSALGINPLARSWANPSDRLNERTEIFTVGFNRLRKRWTTHNNVSLQLYHIDNSSTTTFIFDRLAAANYLAIQPTIPNDTIGRLYREQLFDQYASDERYSSAGGFDVRVESRLNAALSRRLFLETGVQANIGAGSPLASYSQFPVETTVFGSLNAGFTRPFLPYNGALLDGTLFGQLEWRSKRLSIVGGIAGNYYLRQGSNPIASPRLAVQYKIDSSWAVFTNYATGFRRPNLFAVGNSYFYNFTSNTVSAGDDFINRNDNYFNKTETNAVYELGVRYKLSNFKSQLIGYMQETHNLLRNNVLITASNYQSAFYGYKNTEGLSSRLWAAQGLFVWENRDFDFSYNKKKSTLASKTEFYIQYARGTEWTGNGVSYSDIFNMPRWTTQFRSSWRLDKFQIMVASNRQTSVLSKALAYKTMFQRNVITERYPTFRTWDLMIRSYLDQHFVVYFLLQNVFNRRGSGLDATGTPDDLLYNPQQGRIWRLGVNYSMN